MRKRRHFGEPKNWRPFAAKAALAIAAVVLVTPGLKAGHRPPWWLPWDAAVHAAVAYVLTLLAHLAFPRAWPMVLAGVIAGLGLAAEGLQTLPAFSGASFEWTDVVANTVGAGLAALPFLLAGWRARSATP